MFEINCRMIIRLSPVSRNPSLVPPSILRVLSVQKERFLCVFDKYFSRVQHVAFLPKRAELLLLHLRRSGIKIANEATIKTLEKSL